MTEGLVKHHADPAAFLIAHRGDQEQAVENTLAAFEAAVAAGARWLECDIQFSRDRVPVVLHDNWLKRLCNDALAMTTRLDLAALRQTCRPHFALLTLEELLAWFADQPACRLFLEIKPTILRRLSEQGVIEQLAGMLHPALLQRIVLISKCGSLLDVAADRLVCPRGWVASGRHKPSQPVDYVFLKRTNAGAIAMWHQRGVKTGVYTVNEAEAARRLLTAGADLIETDFYGRMARELGDG